MKRLSLASLDELAPAVARPAYDPRRIDIGIVHLGIGAFHRAQTAVYSDDALALEGGAWGICGVSLRAAEVRALLAPQDGLYTAVEKSPAGIRRRVIGSVREVLFLGGQRDAVLARLTAPATRIVTLTITEKGYCHDPATGKLDFAHPDIVHDLADPTRPRSAIGLIAAALATRQHSGMRAFTVLCCDNLPHNGALVRGLVLAFAAARDAALARWIESSASFPSTMVDRIVPATTGGDIAENDAALGLHDAAPVMHEPFRQWAIEDGFVAGRPAWERAGAQFVADVAPFEAMKLRLLNGSHSAMAYLGYLAGHEFIYQVAAQPEFVALVRRLMRDEVAPTLRPPPGIDLAAYQNALLARFSNPALPHRTQQIAMDGSQKLPQRLLDTVRDNLAARRDIDLLTLAVAGWMRYVSGIDEAGREIVVADPLAGEFARIAAAHRGNAAALAREYLGLRAVFGADLPANPRFAGKVAGWLAALLADGAARTVARAAETVSCQDAP
ncbi:MAG TPA: mannitol dehydrogenase family protein [Casimicrobiaceae bacterium]|jgi:fructuronate reductase|nr:mannitol dehydrogenase family protein [Casimicrobiaceae bacterium]